MKHLTTPRFRGLCLWISRCARVFAFLTLLAGVALAPIQLFPSNVYTTLNGNKIPLSELQLPARILLALVCTFHIALLFVFLRSLARLCALYAQGLYFAPQISRCYSRLAACAMLEWITFPLSIPLVFLLRKFSAASALWHVNLDLGLPTLFVALLLFILSHVMAEGLRLQEEQNLTV